MVSFEWVNKMYTSRDQFYTEVLTLPCVETRSFLTRCPKASLSTPGNFVDLFIFGRRRKG